MVAGATIGLAFLRNRLGLVARVVLITAVGLGLASMLSLKIPIGGLQGREFSADQLVANVVSLGGKEEPGNLGGTVEGRQQLWSRILDKQINDGRLVDGSGFGQNLAAEVGVYDDGKDTLRSPHNSHLHILARMGVVGISLWIALWVGWYWRLVAGCRRLAREGLHRRRQVAVLSLMVTTADPGVLLLRSPAGGTAGRGSAVDHLRDRGGGDHRMPWFGGALWQRNLSKPCRRSVASAKRR